MPEPVSGDWSRGRSPPREPDVPVAQTAPCASLASPRLALYSCHDLRVYHLHLLIPFCLLSRLACKPGELRDFALFIAVSQVPKRAPGTQQCSVNAWVAE